MQVEIDIPKQRVLDLLITALETTRWCKMPGYHLDAPSKILDGKEWCVYNIWETDENCVPEQGYITAEKCKKALRLMAEKYRSHFGDFMKGNEDAETGDVFLQLAVLGEVVYG